MYTWYLIRRKKPDIPTVNVFQHVFPVLLYLPSPPRFSSKARSLFFFHLFSPVSPLFVDFYPLFFLKNPIFKLLVRTIVPHLWNVFLSLVFIFVFVSLRWLWVDRRPTIHAPNVSDVFIFVVVVLTLTLLALQSRLGDTPVKFQVVCLKLSPKRDCSPKKVNSPPQYTRYEYVQLFVVLTLTWSLRRSVVTQRCWSPTVGRSQKNDKKKDSRRRTQDEINVQTELFTGDHT